MVDRIVDSMCQSTRRGSDRHRAHSRKLARWLGRTRTRPTRTGAVSPGLVARRCVAIPSGSPPAAGSSFAAGAALGRVNDMPNLVAHKRVRRILLRLMAEHADRMTPAQVAAAFEDIAGCTALPDILDGARDERADRASSPMSVAAVRIAWGMKDRMLPFMRYGAPMLARRPCGRVQAPTRRRTRADDRRSGLDREHDSRFRREQRRTPGASVMSRGPFALARRERDRH